MVEKRDDEMMDPKDPRIQDYLFIFIFIWDPIVIIVPHDGTNY